MHRLENVPSTIDEFRCWLNEQIDALPQSDFALSDFRQAAETAVRAGEIAVSFGLPDLSKQYPIQHGYLGIGATRVLLREYLDRLPLTPSSRTQLPRLRNSASPGDGGPCITPIEHRDTDS